MQVTLITAGVVCVMAAIVGGGLKFYNIELPLISSVARQALLAVFGLTCLILALVFGRVSPAVPDLRESPIRAPTGTSEADRRADTTWPSPLPMATGRGATPPCDQVTVAMQLLERSGGDAVFRVEVTNDYAAAITLPALEDVTFVDAAGHQWQQDRFANLGGRWTGNNRVASGGTFHAEIIFDVPRATAPTGRLDVPSIAPAESPFQTCNVRVAGVPLSM